MLDSFKKYTEQLTVKGAACDIARQASGLRTRAKELMEFEVIRKLTDEVCQVEVKFSSQLEMAKFKQIFGELKVQTMNKASAADNSVQLTQLINDTQSSTTDDNFMSLTEPVKVIPSTGQAVTGLTTLDDELFVVRYSSRQIDVYDVPTLNNKRQLSLPTSATSHNRGLAVCDINRCLYVCDHSGNCIYKVDVNCKTPTTQWTVGSQPFGLSLNSDHNVLVACCGANKIQEYTPVGVLIRDILLQSNITNPTHVIQLSSGQFGVIHVGSLHRYCVVDVSGQVVKTYGSTRGSGVGQLNYPYGLAVNKRGFVFIADFNNNRIVVLDPLLLTCTQLSVTVDGGLKQPYCLHLDRSGRRLYIGEWSGRRVVVLEQ
jgi:DNA-binding beta-propeller fold protein YncE